jgi:hypothetical protein
MNVIKSVRLLCYKHKIISFEAIKKLFFIVKITDIDRGICSKMWYVSIVYVIACNIPKFYLMEEN